MPSSQFGKLSPPSWLRYLAAAGHPRLRQEEDLLMLERTSSPFSLLDVGICSNMRKQ